MVDLFAEVDEDVRAERARAAAKRWAPVAGVAVVALIAAVGVWQEIVSHRAARDLRLSGAYFDAQIAADTPPAAGTATPPRALALFASLDDAPAPGIRTLARLREAALLGEKGNDAAAIRVLDTVASDSRAPTTLRDLALLLSVDRQIETGNPATLRLRLASLETPGAPFRPLALEAGALIDLAHGRTDAARRVLSGVVADGAAPVGLRERAGTLLQAIGAAAPGGRG